MGKFREGDVVRCEVTCGPHVGLEGVVRRGTGGGGGFFLEGWPDQHWSEACFALLRRPVKVGDMLAYGGDRFAVHRISVTEGRTFAHGASTWGADDSLELSAQSKTGAWTHLSGHPIDVPAIKAPCGADKCERCDAGASVVRDHTGVIGHTVPREGNVSFSGGLIVIGTRPEVPAVGWKDVPAVMAGAMSVADAALRKVIDDEFDRQTAAKVNYPRIETVAVREDRLARALFESDPEVRAYVRTRCDDSVDSSAPTRLRYEGRPTSPRVSITVSLDRMAKAIDACWRVNDRGHRARCEARAAEVLALLEVSK
jgi:hypothetical protein